MAARSIVPYYLAIHHLSVEFKRQSNVEIISIGGRL